MLSVLRLTDFLPSDQQFHISLPYGATGHGGGRKKKTKNTRSTFKASLVHLRKASLRRRGAETRYPSRGEGGAGDRQKNVTGRSVRNDEVLMSTRLWRSLIIAIVFLRGPLMNFHTSDSLVRVPFSDCVALLFHTIPSELCITLSFPFFLALSFSLSLSLKGLVWIF